MNTAIRLADPPATTLVILDIKDKVKQSHEIIPIKIEESLNFVVKIKL